MTKTIEAPVRIKEVVPTTPITLGKNLGEKRGPMTFEIHVMSFGQHTPGRTVELRDDSNSSCPDASCPSSSCNVPNTDARANTCQYTCWNGCRR